MLRPANKCVYRAPGVHCTGNVPCACTFGLYNCEASACPLFLSHAPFTLWLLTMRTSQALANNSPAGRFHQIDGVVLTKFDTIDTKVFVISPGGTRRIIILVLMLSLPKDALGRAGPSRTKAGLQQYLVFRSMVKIAERFAIWQAIHHNSATSGHHAIITHETCSSYKATVSSPKQLPSMTGGRGALHVLQDRAANPIRRDGPEVHPLAKTQRQLRD